MFCGETLYLEVFREYLVLLLLTVNAFLLYLNNLWMDRCPRVTLTFWTTLLHTCLPQTPCVRQEEWILDCSRPWPSVRILCVNIRVTEPWGMRCNRAWSGLVLLWLGVLLHFAIPEGDCWVNFTTVQPGYKLLFLENRWGCYLKGTSAAGEGERGEPSLPAMFLFMSVGFTLVDSF